MMLSEIGVNIAPIIASAGILGIALGFGAQSLVSDFLSGIFMIFEDQYGVGDEVDLGEAVGTVEAVSLRVTRLRDVNGTVWYVRNGEILRVGNMSQNWARTVLDISVAYGEDLAQVQRVLADVAHDLWEDEDFKGRVIEEPSVWGVQDLTPDAVVVRVALKTAPLEQWAVAREMRQRIKARFDHEGIEMPFAQRVVWHALGRQRAGAARGRRRRRPAGRGPCPGRGSGLSPSPHVDDTTARPSDPPRPSRARAPAQASAASSVIGTAASACETGQPALASSARLDEVVVVDALDDAAHRELDAGDAGAGREVDGGRWCPATSPGCRSWPGRWRRPSRSTTSGPRRSAPRGWSCRWPPRRGRARTRRRCRGPEDSRVTLPAPSKRVPSQWVVAVRVVGMQCSLCVGDRVGRPSLPRPPDAAARRARHNGTGDEHLLRRDRRRGDDPPDRAHVLRGRGRRPGAAAALPRGGPRPGRGALRAVPHPVLGRADDVLRHAAATRGCGCGTRRSR